MTDTLEDERFEIRVLHGANLRSGTATRIVFGGEDSPLEQSAKPSIENVPPVQPARPARITNSFEAAVARASAHFTRELPAGSTIAVISISSNDRDLAAYAIDELEYQLAASKKFTMAGRQALDVIRSEQQLQISGAASDRSAVSIGNMLGATMVITGSITGTGDNQRLTLKVLDVKVARIVLVAREQF